MGKHAAPRPRTPWPALGAALVLIMSTGAAPPREASTPPAAAAPAAAAQTIQAQDAALAYPRVTVTTAPAPAKFAGLGLGSFQATYEGLRIILPGYSTAECMAVFSHYNYEAVHGDSYNAPGAQDLWLTNDWTRYDRIPADAPARAGDVAVWAGSFGAYRGGGYGHVAIVLTDQGDTITALSQNPNPTAVMALSKSGLFGYLRPHELNP